MDPTQRAYEDLYGQGGLFSQYKAEQMLPAVDGLFGGGPIIGSKALEYARAISGGMPFEQIVQPGMEFSTSQPMGRSVFDINFSLLPGTPSITPAPEDTGVDVLFFPVPQDNTYDDLDFGDKVSIAKDFGGFYRLPSGEIRQLTPEQFDYYSNV
jgi:hypothetical protein